MLRGVTVAAAFGVFCLGLSCASSISQDAHTGADGKEKGAKAITLDNGEGKAKGVVTYPGGDRVDWKVVEMPADKHGSLDIKLTWTPPRPGLQLAFDVFDEWNTQVGATKKTTGKKHSKGLIRTATIDNAKGKYFIRVYAVNRGDAGTYKLTLEFKETSALGPFDVSKIEVPDPPKLAEIPAAEASCDEFTFDVKNPACRNVCPTANAPPGWPACKGKCPDPPSVDNQACWATMPCPKPPNRNVKACRPKDFPKCPDVNNPDPDNPNCDGATAPPVKGRVLSVSVSGTDTIVEISVGSDQGVKKDWKCKVLRGETEAFMDGGDAMIIRVDKRQTVLKVRMTTDQVNANPHIKCSAPPR
jgi:hypothetical protein